MFERTQSRLVLVESHPSPQVGRLALSGFPCIELMSSSCIEFMSCIGGMGGQSCDWSMVTRHPRLLVAGNKSEIRSSRFEHCLESLI